MNAIWQVLLALLAVVGLLRGGELARFTIVIADSGLNDTGRRVAAALLTGSRGMVLCPMEQLETYLRT